MAYKSLLYIICRKALRLINIISHILFWCINDFLWILVNPRKRKIEIHNNFTIGVVTYINRYNKYFVKLIKCLTTLFPDAEIIIAINGYYDQEKQKAYLVKITKLLKGYPNVSSIDYLEGQSLSKLWNQLIIKSKSSKIVILNDDIKLSLLFRKHLNDSGVLKEDVAILNSSWSHFIISKNIIRNIGWFDERFLGVGNEDWDYEARLVVNSILLKSFHVKGLKNEIYLTKDFSYSPDTSVINKKYVKGNSDFFYKKWDCSEIQKEGFVWVRILGKYTRLKSGMNTPNFYSDIII